MKKLLPIIIVVALVLVGAGGYMVMSNKGGNPLNSATNSFTSIKDALSKSISLECDYTDETGRKVKSWIKNGAVRADVTSSNPDEAGSTIVKEKKMYFWNAKSAISLTLTDEAQKEVNNQANEITKDKEVVNEIEKYKSSCKPAVVSDSLFTPPANINFQDMSKLLQVPSGKGNVAPQVNEQDIQKYIQQAQQGQEVPSGN